MRLMTIFSAFLREGLGAQCQKRKRHKPFLPCLPLRQTRGMHLWLPQARKAVLKWTAALDDHWSEVNEASHVHFGPMGS